MARPTILVPGLAMSVAVLLTTACNPNEVTPSRDDASAGQSGQGQGGSVSNPLATGGRAGPIGDGGTDSATGGVAMTTGGTAGTGTLGVATGGDAHSVTSAGNAATLAGASSMGGRAHTGGVSTVHTAGTSAAGAAGNLTSGGAAGSAAAGSAAAGQPSSAGSSGFAGGPSLSQRVLTSAQSWTGLELFVSIYDGFMAPSQSESYVIDLATRDAKFTSTVTGATPNAATATASAEQLQQILDTLRQTEYHAQPDCRSLAIDGAAYPPRLTLVNGATRSPFSVSNATCTKSDHSAYGNVMSCGAFSAILDQVRAILHTGQAAGCQSYW